MPNYLHALTFSVPAAGALFVSPRFLGHVISPFGFFFGTWFAALDYIPLGTAAERLIALSTVSFGLRCLLVYFVRGRSALLAARPFNPTRVSAVELLHLIFLFYGLGMIGLGDFLRDVQRAVGVGNWLA